MEARIFRKQVGPRRGTEHLAAAGVAKTEKVEGAEKEKNRKILEEYFEEMYDLELFPVVLMQLKRDLGWEDEYAQGTDLDRPFGVFQVAKTDRFETSVYKSEQSGRQEGHGLDRELSFYQRLLPKVLERIPPAIRSGLAFPELLGVYETTEGKPKGIHLSYLEGHSIGNHDVTYEGVLQDEDLDRIAYLIKAIQSITVDELRTESPGTEVKDIELKSREPIFKRKEAWLSNFPGREDELFVLAVELLDRTQEQLKKLPPMVQSEDILQSNLLKLEDGRLGAFDWERLHVGEPPNPGDDYAKVVTRMWNVPELQNSLIRKIIKANEEIVGFKDMLKTSVLARHIRLLVSHYMAILRERDIPGKRTPEQIEEAMRAVPAITGMIQELLLDLGPWSPE